jgi:hypothetical protein
VRKTKLEMEGVREEIFERLEDYQGATLERREWKQAIHVL